MSSNLEKDKGFNIQSEDSFELFYSVKKPFGKNKRFIIEFSDIFFSIGLLVFMSFLVFLFFNYSIENQIELNQASSVVPIKVIKVPMNDLFKNSINMLPM
jgi:hypothetical protein